MGSETIAKEREGALLPKEYVSIEIKVASLTGILMWWLKEGIHYSSEHVANQIQLMYRSKDID